MYEVGAWLYDHGTEIGIGGRSDWQKTAGHIRPDDHLADCLLIGRLLLLVLFVLAIALPLGFERWEAICCQMFDFS